MSGLVGFTATFLYFYVIFGESSARISLQTADKDVSSIDFATFKTIGTPRNITIINRNESIPVICSNEDDIPVLIKSENSQYSVDIRCVKKHSVAAPASLTPNFRDITNNNGHKFICNSRLYALETNNGEQFITICFDPNKLSPKWARHILHHTNEKNGKRWEFNETYMECGNCLYKYGGVYLQNKLQKGIKYHRGHLCPACDFHEDEKKRSTFVLINTVPMWSTLNCGSWRAIEELIRKNVKTYKKFEIYTGSFSLRPEAEDPVMELHKGFGNQKGISVHQYVWKIVIYEDPANGKKKGVVFVGINDPNYENDPHSKKIKKPTCTKCYDLIYCCKVDSFLKLKGEWPIKKEKKDDEYEYLVLHSKTRLSGKRPHPDGNRDNDWRDCKRHKYSCDDDCDDDDDYEPSSNEDEECDVNDKMIDWDS